MKCPECGAEMKKSFLQASKGLIWSDKSKIIT